jgi:hypothetical protein
MYIKGIYWHGIQLRNTILQSREEGLKPFKLKEDKVVAHSSGVHTKCSCPMGSFGCRGRGSRDGFRQNSACVIA